MSAYNACEMTFTYCPYAAVVANGFIGRDMTIRNTAGIIGQQAVALRAGADQMAFANLALEGYQVTSILMLPYNFKIWFPPFSLFGAELQCLIPATSLTLKSGSSTADQTTRTEALYENRSVSHSSKLRVQILHKLQTTEYSLDILFIFMLQQIHAIRFWHWKTLKAILLIV